MTIITIALTRAFMLAVATAAITATATFYLGPVVPVMMTIGVLALGIAKMATRVERKPWMPIAVVAAMIVMVAPPAFADISVGQAFGAWREYIDAVVTALIVGGIGLILALIHKKLGLSIEDSQRQALQTALTNAAGLALNALGNKLDGVTVSTKNVAIDQAVDYALKAAPSAIAKFGLSPADLREKILAKLPQVANTSAPANG